MFQPNWIATVSPRDRISTVGGHHANRNLRIEVIIRFTLSEKVLQLVAPPVLNEIILARTVSRRAFFPTLIPQAETTD